MAVLLSYHCHSWVVRVSDMSVVGELHEQVILDVRMSVASAQIHCLGDNNMQGTRCGERNKKKAKTSSSEPETTMKS